MKNINIEKLVEDIKSGELSHRDGTWGSWCANRDLSPSPKHLGKFYPVDYTKHMTALYTLRSFCRGRMHRKNPPECIRGFNRSMRESGRSESQTSWDMEIYNRRIAESVASGYPIEIEEVDRAVG